MPTRNVVITDHQAELIEELVESGRYQNASEVLREGLRLLEERNAENAAKLKVLRDAVNVGLADLDAGRYETFETGKALDKHLAKLASRTRAQRRK